MSETTQAAPTAARRGQLMRGVTIGLTSFLTLIDLFGPQAILPSLVERFDTTPQAMGSAVNASTIGMAVAGVVVALFSRHIDRKQGIWVSLALLALPTVLLAFTTDLAIFTGLRVAQGVFMSAAFTLTMAYLAEECSATEAAGAMAAYITGNVASNLLGRLLAAWIGDIAGLPGSFIVFGLLNLAGAFLVLHCIGQSTRSAAGEGAAKSPLQVWRRHLTNPPLIAGFTIGFLILFAFIGTFTYVNFVLVQPPLSLSGTALGLVYLVFLPSMATTPMAGALVAAMGVRRTFWFSTLVALIGLALLLVPALVSALAGLAMVAIGTFCAQAATTGFIGRAATDDRAAASGIYLASYYLGGLAGSLVLGAVFAGLGWAATVLGIGLALILAAILAVRLVVPKQ